MQYDLDGVHEGTHVHVHISITAEFVIYDDACHLKKYACNPVRCSKTPTAQKLASLTTVVDRFHFAGHVDPWCQENCNPYKFESLKKVSVSHTTFTDSKIGCKLKLYIPHEDNNIFNTGGYGVM